MDIIEKMLVKKCKNGDVEAFEQLISSHQKKVFNICYRYLRNYDDASELSQEIFIKIFKSISSFKGNSLLSTWIYRIATTTCIDELRKRKNDNVISMEDKRENNKNSDFIDKDNNPHDKFETNEIKKQVNEAIKSLSEEFRMAIILRDIQGFSYDEIAQMLDTPLGTIKSRIRRGRNYIKEYLMQNGNFFQEVSSN